MFNDIKDNLRIQAAKEGIRIPENDPINILIDVIAFWISENNKSILDDVISKSIAFENQEKRERIKQTKILTGVLEQLPIKITKKSQNDIRAIVELSLSDVSKKFNVCWYKSPLFLLVIFNFFVNCFFIIYFLINL